MKTKTRLFVIDDDIDIQDVIVGFFRPKGYEVKAFTDAEDALDKLKKDPQSCDIILTDYKLPNMSGLELTTTLKEEGITAPIILMTSHRTSEMAIEAIKAGAYDFVVKPLHFPQLLVSVERALYLHKVQAENNVLKAVVSSSEGTSVDGIIGKSPQFLKTLDLAKRVANSSSSILISGQSGSGKEVIAKTIHQLSNRKKFTFVAINCTAIPENLLESELFGYAKGSFTGAIDKKIGLFEEANKGTIFLDEIGDLSLPLQAKLLRVLQEQKIKRIGENQYRDINVRVISATHKNLKKEVLEKRFREDLFFRLNVIPIHVPSLADRIEDILPLSEFFLRKYAALNNSKATGFSKDAMEYLLKNTWKGNVRELQNVIERAVVLATTGVIEKKDLTMDLDEPTLMSQGSSASDEDNFNLPKNKILPLNEVINKYIQYALTINNGAKDRTARDLSIDRKTLYRRVQDYQLN
ncbi:MAG: sigma-54-dependent transcriptional regulator [Bdellovibrionales bacterium]